MASLVAIDSRSFAFDVSRNYIGNPARSRKIAIAARKDSNRFSQVRSISCYVLHLAGVDLYIQSFSFFKIFYRMYFMKVLSTCFIQSLYLFTRRERNQDEYIYLFNLR